MSGNERGKGMREEIRTFINYMEEEKHASKNTTLSYQRDLLKMADYLEPDPLSVALEREAQSQALEAVRCLAERDQEVIWKHLIQEIQLKDIAREKGLRPANMRRIYALSLRNLKRVYREKFEFEDATGDT